MKKRQLVASGAKWENIVGYSRAVRIGNVIEVSGTTAVENDRIVYADDAYRQTRYVIQKIEKALKEAGSSLDDVIRTRMFVTDISLWEEYGKAHGEFFKELKPATSMVEVQALIHPDMMLEMEATAIIADS